MSVPTPSEKKQLKGTISEMRHENQRVKKRRRIRGKGKESQLNPPGFVSMLWKLDKEKVMMNIAHRLNSLTL